MVAWRDAGVGGMSIDPAAAQSRRATLVVANLQFATPTPRRDVNIRTQPRRGDSDFIDPDAGSQP
jgi:hypothetical protein